MAPPYRARSPHRPLRALCLCFCLCLLPRLTLADAGDHKRQIVWAINGLLLLVILPAAISGVTAAKERAARLRCRRRRKEDAEDLAVLA